MLLGFHFFALGLTPLLSLSQGRFRLYETLSTFGVSSSPKSVFLQYSFPVSQNGQGIQTDDPSTVVFFKSVGSVSVQPSRSRKLILIQCRFLEFSSCFIIKYQIIYFF